MVFDAVTLIHMKYILVDFEALFEKVFHLFLFASTFSIPLHSLLKKGKT